MSEHLDHLIAKERAEATAAERERCAKIVDDFEGDPKAYKRHPRTRTLFRRLAEAIRREL